MNSSTQPKVPISEQRAPVDPCAITARILLQVTKTLPLASAEIHAAALEAARLTADLTTPKRVRHFLAQCAHETSGFLRLEENLRYSDPVRLDKLFSAVRDVHHARGLISLGPQHIANCVYAGRNGNGDSQCGDGWKYRGRGYLQITGRANYRKVGDAIGMALEDEPDLLLHPRSAALAAAGFWKWQNINAAADCDAIRAVTALINPAQAGLDERTAWLGRFREFYP